MGPKGQEEIREERTESETEIQKLKKKIPEIIEFKVSK